MAEFQSAARVLWSGRQTVLGISVYIVARAYLNRTINRPTLKGKERLDASRNMLYVSGREKTLYEPSLVQEDISALSDG
jgi:hypothetical protein